MSHDPDLYAVVLRLRAEGGGGPAEAGGQHAQALFLDLVRQADPALAQALHSHAPSKPASVALLPPERAGDAAPLELRATLLRADLFQALTRALLRQGVRPALLLGRRRYALEDVLATPGSHPWAGFGSFAALAEQAAPAASLTLCFASPTVFTRGELADGRARLGLLPEPAAVFGSLARRWAELAPPELAVAAPPEAVLAAAAETLVSRYRLETHQIDLGRGPQKGFTGACTYDLPADPQQRRALATLADAAFYLGCGAKTARGMGLCRRRTNDQRPTTSDERRRTKDEGRTTNDEGQ